LHSQHPGKSILIKQLSEAFRKGYDNTGKELTATTVASTQTAVFVVSPTTKCTTGFSAGFAKGT
jgi:hypothetical protein